MGGRPERRPQDSRAFAQVEELEPRLCLGALEPPQIPEWDCANVPAEIASAAGHSANAAATLQELLQPFEIQADPASYPATDEEPEAGASGENDAELAQEDGESGPVSESSGLGNQVVAALMPLMFVGAVEDDGAPPPDSGSGSGGSGGSAGGSFSDPGSNPAESPLPPADSGTGGPVTPVIDQGGGSNVSSGQVPFSDNDLSSIDSLQSPAMSEVPSGAQSAMNGGYTYIADAPPVNGELSSGEVLTLLQRASMATASEDGIFAIVDRNGRILGVRVEAQVPIAMADTATLVFAIDGAVAKARTAAFFASAGDPNDTSDGPGPSGPTPLTSRTIRSLSETTITQREVEANPNSADPSIRGPGFVAPIGVAGHFPPGVQHTPQVDLFNIEASNRDSLILAGANGIRENGAGDDITLATRFNATYDPGKALFAPESYGLVSGLMPTAQSRGIATLPGGIPIIRNNADVNAGTGFTLAGGLGAFFPGTNGYATFEQGFQAGVGQTALQRLNAPKVLEAEYIAAAALGLNNIPGAPGTPGGVFLPSGRIDLVGLQLEVIGPGGSTNGPKTLTAYGVTLGVGTNSGTNMQVTTNPAVTAIDGLPVPTGWLVSPRASLVDNITADDVNRIIQQGITEANLTRAAIRLPLGRRTKMVLAVGDSQGNILGLFRMDDSTIFSIDIAVAKARNAAYYANPAQLQAVDQVPGIAAGVPFTARTFRFLAEPRYPSGVDFTQPAPFSILNDPGINAVTGENTGAPTPFASFQSVLGYDKFNPGHNFRNPGNLANQNGIVFFPGSSAVYKGGVLVGGYGTSGDGVDQDDVITAAAMQGFSPQEFGIIRADQVFFRDARLPYMKFNRNPRR